MWLASRFLGGRCVCVCEVARSFADSARNPYSSEFAKDEQSVGPDLALRAFGQGIEPFQHVGFQLGRRCLCCGRHGGCLLRLRGLGINRDVQDMAG